jgi:hypothetical protein
LDPEYAPLFTFGLLAVVVGFFCSRHLLYAGATDFPVHDQGVIEGRRRSCGTLRKLITVIKETVYAKEKHQHDDHDPRGVGLSTSLTI